ncbi:MAG: imidazole glycerol phosphate synthase subunit HisF [Deltaproteobacteria bacterium]|nr:imidazole glycerol phosphate synthase subunit HisF [Deltaproteobacteria bacterium]
MLKVRIIPTLLYKNFGLVKGISFDSWRRVGSALQTIMVYSMREVDELIFLDITATGEQRDPDFEVVDDLADDCFMPLTVGGGIQTIHHVRQLLMMGADKVAINSGAVGNPQLIKDIANRFGSQCAVVSIDYKTHANGVHEIFTHSGTRATGLSPVAFAKQAEEMGAGEILLTSIDRDGTMQGYEPDCLRQVSTSVSIPVIASGGAGNPEDMYLAIDQGKASAVAAASIFHFTEQTPLEMKQYLRGKNIPVRL